MLRPFPSYPLCPVCGDPAVNPATLGVRWWWDPELRLVVGRFTPGPAHAGYENQVHGGIMASLADEALAWACAVERGSYCVTGELTLRYAAPAPVAETLRVTASAGESWGRYVRATARLELAGGLVAATATGTFAAMPRDQALRLHGRLHIASGDFDILVGPEPGE